MIYLFVLYDSLMAPASSFSFLLAGAKASCLLLGPPAFIWCLCFTPGFSKLFGAQGSPPRAIY